MNKIMYVTICGDHFAVYINIESLCFIPETKYNVICQFFLN